MGYSYADWVDVFYPRGLARGKWLAHYATRFGAVEMNTTFHAAPTPPRVRGWAGQAPDGFRFAIKTPRAITHDIPLTAAAAPMRAFLAVVRDFQSLLGPILIQLPPHVTISALSALDTLLAGLPDDLRFAVEFRHSSWVVDRVTDVLSAHRAAWVGLDHLDHPALRRLRATAADFLYVRLVGRHGRFGDLGRELIDVEPQLHHWHKAIVRELDRAGGRIDEVWVLANNDYAGHAPATLRRFAQIAGVNLPAADPVSAGLFGA